MEDDSHQIDDEDDLKEESIEQKEAKEEGTYSLGSGHFLTGEEGSSSSFANGSKGSEGSGNVPDSDETWI